MKKEKLLDPTVFFPIPNSKTVTYVKPTIDDPNVVVGDYTYFGDVDFAKHVTHHYGFLGDKLVIGKFCQIASGVNFVMNGANHQLNALSTYPFYVIDGWDMQPPALDDLPLKGDTVVGNDVWIGQNVTVLPGVHIGDGAIIGLGSVVAGDVPPYCVAVGNPARVIKKRFDDQLIELMEKLQWWNLPVEQINGLIPVLTCSDLEKVRQTVEELVNKINR